MAATEAVAVSAAPPRAKRIAGAIVSGHAFQHMYADGFLVLLDPIYQAFGLNPISAGAIAVVRQASGGITTMGGGFIVDMFAGKRGMFLAGSLFLMGLGYLMAGVAPNYAVLLIALTLGTAAGSFWHPVGLGLLSGAFPQNRALMMSIHRSAGGLGETITPIAVGFALAVITWRQVLLAGFLIIVVVAVALFVVLSRLGLEQEAARQSAAKQGSGEGRRGAGEQFRSIGMLFTDRTLPTLLLVSGIRGMADRALIFFLPLFIGQALRTADAGISDARVAVVIGFHLTLMSAASIGVPVVIGALSDKVGRRPMMMVSLAIMTLLTGLLSLVAPDGITVAFTVLIGILGAFRFAVTNLTQASALDIAEGRRLEGSMIGLLWGNNALFGALSPLLLGVLVSVFATASGADNFGVIFPYAAALNLVGLIAAFFLPKGGERGRMTVRSAR